jgi:hypothetical protein
MITHNGKVISGVWQGGKAIGFIYHLGKLAWQANTTKFFTRTEKYIETRDGLVFDSKEI